MWCADDSSRAGKFNKLRAFYNLVAMHGPKHGYYPEADKSMLVVAEENVEAATEHFATEGFKIRTGARHLGSYIGAIDNRDEWI